MADATPRDAGPPTGAPRPRFLGVAGLVPFFVFAVTFLLLPVAILVVGSFRMPGQITIQNYATLRRPDIANAFWLTIEISLVTAFSAGCSGS